MNEAKIDMIKTHDSYTLKVTSFEPKCDPIGVVQIIHGFGEHAERYYELADFFTSNGYVCVACDQRGHGEMPGLNSDKRQKMLGVIKKYDDLLDDVGLIHSEIARRYPGLPIFLYAHSMGGNIALNYLLRRSQTDFDKVILESPWIHLYKKRPRYLITLSHFLGCLNKNIVSSGNLNTHILSRNPSVAEAIKNDKHFHTQMSLRLFAKMTYAGEYALKHASDIKSPTLLLCGGKDKIACPKAMREFNKKSGGNVVLFEDAEGYHMLRLDAKETKTTVLNRVLEFLKSGQ